MNYLSPAGNALAAYVGLMIGAAGMAAFGLAEFMSYVGGIIAAVVAIALVARGINEGGTR
jgi:hypothetical protein